VYQNYPAWRNYREYGSGAVGDWGAHQLDIAQWGLGMDDSGPAEVIPPADPDAQRGAKLVYAGGVTVEHKDGFGVHFFGTGGEARVNRGRFALVVGGKTIADSSASGLKQSGGAAICAAEVQKAEGLFLANARIRLYASHDHIGNFLSCVKSRKKPIANEQVGARTAICCHLLNQSYYHHARLKWNPARFKFTGGTGDRKWLTRDYRAPWTV